MARVHFQLLAALIAVFSFEAANAATSVALPTWICTHPDSIFVNGLESSASTPPSTPSGGSGGHTGSQARTLHIAGLGTGTQNYYIYVPGSYSANRPMPILLALHGVAPYGEADTAASDIRDTWINTAVAGRFIVVAPVANAVYNDSNDQPYAVSWLIPPTSGPSDYDLFSAVRADMEAAYNIERTRIYGWGFSAGAHVMHDLGVNDYSSAFNATTMAAYGVSAGDLAGLACLGYSDAGCSSLLAALPRKIPVDIHVGLSDPNYPYAFQDHARFLAQHWVDGQTIHFTTFDGGHEYDETQLGEIWGNLCPNAVVP